MASNLTQSQQQRQGNNCNDCCVQRYESFFDIPWRVYCKKGCLQDKWEDCREVCRELCYKDPLIDGKSFQWTAVLDRSPGVPSHSLVLYYLDLLFCGKLLDLRDTVAVFDGQKCTKASVRGCGFKFHSMAAMFEASTREEPVTSNT